MKKLLFFLSITVCLASVSFAQDDSSTVATKVGEGVGRFEIIQVPRDSRTTFRLDKFSGRIYRLGDCPKVDVIGSQKCWKEMIVVDLPAGLAARPRYQIVINGLLKMIMLLQVETGQTWQYGIEPTE